MKAELPLLYPILDTATLERRGCDAFSAAAAMLEGGARILQFRHKGNFTRGVFEQAERIAGLCRSAGALYIIDDRADIAMMLDAGLHVGQDDVPAHIARRLIGPDRILGYSTHNQEQVAAAAGQPVDYLAFGPVNPTASKENPDPVAGLDGLRAACGIEQQLEALDRVAAGTRVQFAKPEESAALASGLAALAAVGACTGVDAGAEGSAGAAPGDCAWAVSAASARAAAARRCRRSVGCIEP